MGDASGPDGLTVKIGGERMSALAQVEVPRPSEDTRELQSAEAQSMVAMGRLVSGVAHDFNNLLTCILLCADLLVAGLDKNSRLQRYAQEIRSAATQGASLVQQLTAAAQPDPDEPSRLLSLNDVIAEIRNLLTRLLGENIQLSTELAPELGRVEMNPAQARQIVLNLSLNARDAMIEGGQLRLITRNSTIAADSDKTGCVELEVCDTGIGMDEQTQSHVFEPFFTTKSPGKGTGLGLSTVLNIVKQHQGTIQIESEPGNGTRVRVRLPDHKFQSPGEGTRL
jgi:two-component system, cell cycle sensor histidine kinase and response regulator CckA